jgi:eukaryotic-like serine/threonine-protein kinase
MRIKDYETTSSFITAGSGNARWCGAVKLGKKYFLKQFLAPVQPVQTTETPTQQVLIRRARCADFEHRKMMLYNALGKIDCDCIVRVEEFFVHDGHYFTASEYIDLSNHAFETIHSMRPHTVLRLLYSLAGCLEALHECGVVHADLKPEHIIIAHDGGVPRIRLIDFDSGFLETAPPGKHSNIEGDPVYLSPEAYRLMTGGSAKLDCKLDTFAFGILIHQALTGEMPGFDSSKYAYLYACVLAGGRVRLSQKLDPKFRVLIRRMLKKNPAARPGDRAICRALEQ